MSLTTDSGANVVAAANLLNWKWISCFGHNLHLAITKALNNDVRCSRALGVVHKIVSGFSLNWKQKRELTKAQLNLKLPQHSLVTDCATQWGSMQKMIGRLLEQEKVIRVVLGSDRGASHLLPTWQDIDVWNVINEALAPLEEFTNVMSGEKC